MDPMRFSVCIDAVFEGVPEVEAIAAVKHAGINAFEFWKWWDKDLEAISDARDEHGLELAAFCTKFISLVDPAARSEYLDGLAATIETASRLGVGTIITQVGDARPGVPREAQQQCLVEGLKAAAPLVEGTGIQLVFEPLNLLVDHVGYFLSRSDEAFEIARAVDSRAVKVLFDIYHQQITEGHLIRNLSDHADLIGYYHAAGNPGRHELDSGEIHYPAVFEAIAATGYAGHIGLEYWPQGKVEEGLSRWAGSAAS